MTVVDKTTRDLIARVLSSPELYPDEFKSWLVRYVLANPNFKLASINLPSMESTHYVGSNASEPGFAAPWGNNGGAYEAVGFFKDSWGLVHLVGVAGSGSAGTVIFTLPDNYRPKARELYATSTDTGAGSVEVSASGNVNHVSGGVAKVALSGMTFRAL